MSTQSIKSKQQKTGIAIKMSSGAKRDQEKAKKSDVQWSKFADTLTIVIFYEGALF